MIQTQEEYDRAVERARKALAGHERDVLAAWQAGLRIYDGNEDLLIGCFMDIYTDELNHIVPMPRKSVVGPLLQMTSGELVQKVASPAPPMSAWMLFWGKGILVLSVAQLHKLRAAV